MFACCAAPPAPVPGEPNGILVPDPLVGGVLEGLVWTVVVTLVVGVAVIVMTVAMFVVVMMFLFVRVAADFHAAAVKTASAFFAHKFVKMFAGAPVNPLPPRRCPVRVRAAVRR